MAETRELILRFYEGLNRKDAKVMISCLAKNVVFSDPIFPHLAGKDVRDMWQMLCSRASDLKVECEVLNASETHAEAVWNAWYTLGKTGRKVHNIVHAKFEIQDGLILRHEDQFSIWRWTRQALGPFGVFFGWLPSVRKHLREQAGESLKRYQKSKKG